MISMYFTLFQENHFFVHINPVQKRQILCLLLPCSKKTTFLSIFTLLQDHFSVHIYPVPRRPIFGSHLPCSKKTKFLFPFTLFQEDQFFVHIYPVPRRPIFCPHLPCSKKIKFLSIFTMLQIKVHPYIFSNILCSRGTVCMELGINEIGSKVQYQS